jgi:hypothetical protein
VTSPKDTAAAAAAWLDGLASGAAEQSNWLASVAGGAAQTAAALRAIDWTGDPPPPPPPPHGDIIDVASDQDFKRAEKLAKPGDTVRMAARAYVENAFGAAGVLYLAGEPGVSVTVPGLVTGVGAIVQGVAFPRGLRLAAPGSGYRAGIVNALDDGTAVALTLDGDGSFAEFAEITDFAHRGVLLTGVGTELRRSHIHGQRAGAKSITDATALLMWGGTHPKDARSIKAVVRYCLVRDGGRHDYAEVKAHDCVADHLTILGGDTPGDLYVRHGARFKAIACTIQHGRLLLGDDDALAIGCVTTGKFGACLGFRRGDATGPDVTKGKGKYPYARNCRGVAHAGQVDTAWSNGTGPQWADKPQGTVLEGIGPGQVRGDGPYSRVPLATDLPADPARPLTPADVGPAAYRP